MAVFYKCFASCLGSQLQPLAVAAAALSTSLPRFSLLTLSRLSTTIAGNDKPTQKQRTLAPFQSSYAMNVVCASLSSQLSLKEGHPWLLRDPLIEPNKRFSYLEIQDSQKTRLLTSSLERTLSPNIQYLQNLLGSEVNVSIVFKWALHILHKRNGPESWENKLKHLASFGLLENEIKELVKKHPLILNASMDKVQKNMDFFMHTAGLPAKFILSQPKLVSCYSLERRIKPRHNVLSAVRAMQPSDLPPSLTAAVNLNERKFLEKYVQRSTHATKLLEIYRSKLALF